MPNNPKYDGKEKLISDALTNHPTVANVKLSQFYDHTTYLAIHTFLAKAKWKKSQNPLEYSYEITTVSPKIQKLLASTLFKKITKKNPAFTAVRLTHKSYSMLLDSTKPKPWTIIADFTPQFDERAGGSITFVGKEETIQLPAGDNVIYIVQSKAAPMFYQYVNHYGTERVFFIAQF
jgi:hypothetical protein